MAIMSIPETKSEAVEAKRGLGDDSVWGPGDEALASSHASTVQDAADMDRLGRKQQLDVRTGCADAHYLSHC
jgi:hypothetical protein